MKATADASRGGRGSRPPFSLRVRQRGRTVRESAPSPAGRNNASRSRKGSRKRGLSTGCSSGVFCCFAPVVQIRRNPRKISQNGAFGPISRRRNELERRRDDPPPWDRSHFVEGPDVQTFPATDPDADVTRMVNRKSATWDRSQIRSGPVGTERVAGARLQDQAVLVPG